MSGRTKEINMGNHKLYFEDSEDVGEMFIKKASEELRETPELRKSALEELKKKLAENDEIEIDLNDDIYLLAYLRTCKFYVDSTYNKIVGSLQFKEKHWKYFGNMYPETEKKAFLTNIFNVMPYRDQNGCRLVIGEAKNWHTKEVSVDELIRCFIIMIEAAMMEPKTQISGITGVIDMQGLTISHAWEITPNLAKITLKYAQDFVPLRIKAIHFVHEPYVFDMIYAIFKPFLLPKLRNRIHFHGNDMSSLAQFYDPKILPSQYGGLLDIETKYCENLYPVVCEYRDKFDAFNARRYKPKKKSDKKK